MFAKIGIRPQSKHATNAIYKLNIRINSILIADNDLYRRVADVISKRNYC